MQEENQGSDEQQPSWQYSGDEDTASSAQDLPPVQEVVWSASEYISHEKGTAWYAGLGVGVSLLALIIYLFTREIVSPIVMIVIGIAFGAFAARKPNELRYGVNANGVQIGNRNFSFDEFKSFSVMEDGHVRVIVLSPLQRFALPISIYYAPQDEEKIVNTLTNYLPYEERQYDLVDRLMKKIRF